MNKNSTSLILCRRKYFIRIPLLLLLVALFNTSFSQCTILTNAVQGISYSMVTFGGSNAGGVAYNPNVNVYYAGIAGNPTFPYETFDPTATPLYQTNVGFDCRGVWWNPNTNEVEMNGYYTFGLWTSDLDINGNALNTGTNLFVGQNQPTDQSCGDYDYDANEILYYSNGSIYRYDRNTDVLLGSYLLTGMPVTLSDINSTTVIYTGCCGNEIGLMDYVHKGILLFNKVTGAYSGLSKLPASAPTNTSFNFSYANNLVWLYDITAQKWTSYSILTGAGATAINLGNDTTLCTGSTLVLSAGSSSYQYAWSTGDVDSMITVSSGGTYWLTVTNGNCVTSDTIVISDTVCIPPVIFSADDTAICEKFCVNFSDSSQNNATAWMWLFPGGVPSSSTLQNPGSVCYSNAGTYDVTLITTSPFGVDTLTLTSYINVYATPPLPTITPNGYVLTASLGSAYQWQFNSVDIPGATGQSYSAVQTGLYTVLVYDEHGCKNSASYFVQIVGIDDVTNGVAISIFPNPNTGSFEIELPAEFQSGTSIDIQNALGQVVYSAAGATPDGKYHVQLPPIQPGIYLVQIRADDTFLKEKILIIQ